MAHPVDPIERAHLRDAAGFSPPIFRYAPDPGLADLVRRHWLPVWSLPPGRTTVQRVLQYPVCLLVVADSYAHLVGPQRGLSLQELAGEGWAVGVMLQPAAGWALAGGPVTRLTDRRVPLAEAGGLDGVALERAVRAAIGTDPLDPERRATAVQAVEDAVAGLLPVDEEGHLVIAVVEHVEVDPRVQRVAQVSAKFGLIERSLQRITARLISLSSQWVVQRRRMHKAADRLRGDAVPDLASVALELGYADQAHFSRDFRRVTGTTPGRFAAEARPRS